MAVPAQSWSAAAPATLPSSLASFQTSMYCQPAATFCRFAGVAVLAAQRDGSRPLACSAPTTPSAVLSFSARMASIVRPFGVGGVDDGLHVVLGRLGLPAIGELVSKDGDLTRVDLLLQAGLVPAHGQERRGIGVTRVALDKDVIAGGHGRQDGIGLGLADAHVVEGYVEDAGILDQAVIGDDRDARVVGDLDGRDGSVLVLRQKDEHVRAAVDRRLDIGLLLDAVELGVEER